MLMATAFGLVTMSPFASLSWASKRTFDEPRRNPYRGTDDQLLDEIERSAFEFFWNEASSTTGQLRDSALLNGGGKRRVASIAATGFGLAGLCLAGSRGYRQAAAVPERGRPTP